MKKTFLLLTAMMLACSMWAQQFTVDGIRYWITSSEEPRTVSLYIGREYSGTTLVIDKVIYNDLEYTITGEIPGEIFKNCTNLTSVTIGNGIDKIGKDAFMGCTNLTSVIIGNSVESIGSNAFKYAPLTSIEIPNSVKSIGMQVFYDAKFTSVTIPGSLTSCESVFDGCLELTEFLVDNTNQHFSSQDGVLFDKEMKTIIRYPYNKQGTSYVIPNSVTSIGFKAFAACRNFKDITIPNSVKDIGESAFWNCFMTSISIPNSVESIGVDAFRYCTYLEEVVLSNSIKTIGKFAFFGCNRLTRIAIPNSLRMIQGNTFADCTDLTTVVIGSSVRLIEDWAFSGCTKLTRVECHNPIPPSLPDWYHQFQGVDGSKCVLYVPAESVGAYEASIFSLFFYNIRALSSTAINQLSKDEINVYSSGSDIVIAGATLGETIWVYTTSGQLVQQAIVTSNETRIALPQGIYIIKVGEDSFKIRN